MRPRVLAALIGLSVLVTTGDAAVVCTPLGSTTATLQLCQPLSGEINWAAAVNNNWVVLDTAFTGAASQVFGAKFSGTGVEPKTLTAGSGITITPGTGFIQIAASGSGAIIPRSYLAGCTLSKSAATTVGIAACMSTSDDQTTVMNVGSTYTKTFAAWAVGTGNGGLDTGAIATSTWYHVFQIERTDSSVVDYLISTSATTPTLPTNYTKQRRLGSVRTDGSSVLLAFTQDGDYFRWAASILDVDAPNPGTAAVTRTLTVPTGVTVEALMNAYVRQTGGNASLAYISDLAATDEAAAESSTPLATLGSGIATTAAAGQVRTRTNTSAQVRSRLLTSDSGTSFRMATLGWYDTRGRNN